MMYSSWSAAKIYDCEADSQLRSCFLDYCIVLDMGVCGGIATAVLVGEKFFWCFCLWNLRNGWQ